MMGAPKNAPSFFGLGNLMPEMGAPKRLIRSAKYVACTRI